MDGGGCVGEVRGVGGGVEDVAFGPGDGGGPGGWGGGGGDGGPVGGAGAAMGREEC